MTAYSTVDPEATTDDLTWDDETTEIDDRSNPWLLPTDSPEQLEILRERSTPGREGARHGS